MTPITAGTTLRVTPHYVQRPEGPVIQLDVDIEDGQIQETTVDTIPTVRRSTVSTQAIVAEGQTLLIGGYKSTQQLNRKPTVTINQGTVVNVYVARDVDFSAVVANLKR